jgi:glycosyltransferase involved in cell wall biosynthesis
MQYSAASIREIEVFRGVDAVMGRTEWDQAQALAMDPDIRYFHGDEALREEFWKARWCVGDCDRFTIVFTNGGEPRRGLETLLRAAALVRTRFPKLRVILAGANVFRGEYGKSLHELVQKLELSDCVQAPGYLNVDAVAETLRSAHVFVVPSLIENSPNSLCEAMLVGVPCVAAYSGGIPSLISHRESGLMFPPREHTMLAKLVADIFSSDDLAVRLSTQARKVARERHDIDKILGQVIGAYRELTSGTPIIQ